MIDRKIDAVTINLLTEKVVTWITNILYIIMYTPRNLLSLIPIVYSTGEKQYTKTWLKLMRKRSTVNFVIKEVSE